MHSALKKAVSLGKRRIYDPELKTDLDLAYMTPHLIAMGFPSVSYPMKIYRNTMEQTVKFLTAKHSTKYKVYNLCSEPGFSYPSECFDSRWTCYPFDDHNPPPFHVLLAILTDIHHWHAADPENVAVVHCKAGKGRTGVVCCAYMLLTGVFPDSTACFEGYTKLRMVDGRWGDGLTVPGQRRWVVYFEEFLRRFDFIVITDDAVGGARVEVTENSGRRLRWFPNINVNTGDGQRNSKYLPSSKKLVRISITGIKRSLLAKRAIKVEVVSRDVVVWSPTKQQELDVTDKIAATYRTDSTLVEGDVCVFIKSNNRRIGRFWFNTFFLTVPELGGNSSIAFGKEDVDEWKRTLWLDMNIFRVVLEFE
ncbi:protein-tyrosine phosphatase-like protein [Obelidium mucronatum]|nr:protein-tyrosine phosphatase-like protein [Obelidium mucronatum]